MCPENQGHINHLSLLHQPLSLCSIKSISFLQKALLKGVLINLAGTQRTQVSLKPFVNRKPTDHPTPVEVIIINKTAAAATWRAGRNSFQSISLTNRLHNVWVTINRISKWCIVRSGKVTCRSDNMLSRLLSRLRSIASPFRSLSMSSRIPSMVLL